MLRPLRPLRPGKNIQWNKGGGGTTLLMFNLGRMLELPVELIIILHLRRCTNTHAHARTHTLARARTESKLAQTHNPEGIAFLGGGVSGKYF